MEEMQTTVKRIRILSTLAILCQPIIMVAIYMEADLPEREIASVFSMMVRMYIFLQIFKAAGGYEESGWKDSVVVSGVRRVAYACIVNAIGVSIINTIVYSTSMQRLYFQVSLSGIAFGILVLVSCSVYEHACERNME